MVFHEIHGAKGHDPCNSQRSVDTLNLGGSSVDQTVVLIYCIPTRSGLSHSFGFLS